MAKLNFNLGTYEKFRVYEERMEKQLGNLKKELALKLEQIEVLQRDYITQFTAGEEPVKLSGKLAEVKTVIAMLENEIEIIEGADITEKALAGEIRNEWNAKVREVMEARESVWNAAVQVQRDADARIAELGLEYEQLVDNYRAITLPQFTSVISSLGVNDEMQKGLHFSAEHSITSSGNFNHVKNYVH